MRRWVVGAATLAAALLIALPEATAACGTERRLLPNGKFETVPKKDCYPDLHSAPMSNPPPDLRDSLDMPSQRPCRMVTERVLQPNGKFRTQQIERCG